MSLRASPPIIFLLAEVAFISGIAWTQVPIGGPAIPGHSPLAAAPYVEKQIWHIFGRVSALNGEPIGAAKVRVDIRMGFGSVKTLETNLRGEFRTEFELDAQLVKRLSVKVAASKLGYLDAVEMVDFGASDKTWGIDIVLRDKAEDPDQLSQAALVAHLTPRLLKMVAADSAGEATHREYSRGAEELLVRRDAVGAVPLLSRVVERRPRSPECRIVLGMALLDAGSWASVARQFAEAAKLSTSERGVSRRTEPLLILGVLESWRREDKKAAGFLMQALEIDPEDPLVLQELGRTLILRRNWEAADQYLEKAISAGAPEEARLLRVRALLEQGDAQEAEAEMKRYMGGRDVKSLPLSARAVYTQLQARLNLRGYSEVGTLVNEPVRQLVNKLPELRGLEPASNQDELGAVLRRAGEAVEAFFRNFPNTISSEQIRQERLGKDGKAKDAFEQKFQYLLLARPEKWGLGLEEYRTNSRGDRTGPTGLDNGFMLTSGFASAPLLFHPAYQSGATFRYLGTQALDGHQTYVVAFSQRPETAQMMERFNTDNASVLVLFQGVAWIDRENFQIVRLRTDLLRPPPKVRLQRQTTDIRYDQV